MPLGFDPLAFAKRRQVFVPEGLAIIAQRFNVGTRWAVSASPGGTAEIHSVVSHAPDLNRLQLILPGDAAHEGPEPFTQFGRDDRRALFGAEDAVDIGAEVRQATH